MIPLEEVPPYSVLPYKTLFRLISGAVGKYSALGEKVCKRLIALVDALNEKIVPPFRLPLFRAVPYRTTPIFKRPPAAFEPVVELKVYLTSKRELPASKRKITPLLLLPPELVMP